MLYPVNLDHAAGLLLVNKKAKSGDWLIESDIRTCILYDLLPNILVFAIFPELLNTSIWEAKSDHSSFQYD